MKPNYKTNVLIPVAITGALLLGCMDAAEDTLPDSGPGVVGEGGCDLTVDPSMVCAQTPAAGAMVNLADAQNYEFSSTLFVDTVPIPGNNSNITFDWSTLTKDMIGHSLNAQLDIDMVLVSVWQMGPTDLMNLINLDQVEQKNMVAVMSIYTRDVKTSETLLNFTSFGTPLSEQEIMPYFDSQSSVYSPDTYTHMVMAATGEVAGKGTRMLLFLTLDDNSITTTVNITDDSTSLDYSVNAKNLTRLPLAAGAAGLVNIDWQYLTANAMGSTFEPYLITEVVIAQYASLNVCGFEDNFLDMELIADQWYRAEISEGTSASLQNLTRADGTPFQGIDTNGTWILALVCGTCNNPAPSFLTVLQPC